MLGIIGEVFLLPLTQCLMSYGQTKPHTLHCWWNNCFLKPLYIGTKVPGVPVPTLALHKIFELVCIFQHCLIKVAYKLASCQRDEGKSLR